MDNTCEKCRYWKVGGNASYVGFCRRFPKLYTKQPTDWCGEWKRVRKAAPAEDLAHVERKVEHTWCEQCEWRVTDAAAAKCSSRFCSVKGA